MKKYLYSALLITLMSLTAKASSDVPSATKGVAKTVSTSATGTNLSQGFLADALSFAGEAIPFDNEQVYSKFINNYNLRNSPDFIANLESLAAKWFPVIEPILAQYGIPDDFKYIPAIESGFSNNARSHSGAVGFWQFMPATAKGYGLTVSRRVDERKNIVKSTIAAARYLNDLYEQLGSWTLVAAAYNVGHGALKNAMSRQQEDDYFSLKLNKETGNYVYKVIVFKHLFENSDNFTPSSASLKSEFPAMESINLMTALGMLGMMKNPYSSGQHQLNQHNITLVKPKPKRKLAAGLSKIGSWL